MATLEISQCLDIELVELSIAGNPNSFGELVNRYRNPVTRWLVSQTADPELSEDICQDALVVAYTRLDELAAPGLFSAWLYRIAGNLLRSEWHRRSLHPCDSLNPEVLRRRRYEPNMLDALEMNDYIEELLSSLSEESRDAILLNCLFGFSAVEIAAGLGITLACAERRISRAKAYLRRRVLASTE